MAIKTCPKTGNQFFRVTVRKPDGTTERISGTPGAPGPYQDLPQNKNGAKEAEKRAIAAALTGVAAVSVSRSKAPTVEEYTETFLTKYLPEQKPSERETKTRILRNILRPYFGPMPMDMIRQEHIGEFVTTQLKKGLKGKTVNNRLSVLSSLLKFAYVNGAIPTRPVLRMKIKAMKAEVIPVPLEDVERLLATAGRLLRLVVLLGAEAGLRAGEMRGLQWPDLKNGQLIVRRALNTKTLDVVAPKHNKMRTIPLSDRLKAELKATTRYGQWVCAKPNGAPLVHQQDLYVPMLRLYDEAGVTLPPRPLHALRHTYGTTLASAGVPLGTIQELMGHASIETTRLYIHVTEQAKRDAVAMVFNSRQNLAERPKAPE